MNNDSWKQNRYKHSVRISLWDTHRMERWCTDRHVSVDDFMRDAILERLDKEDENKSTGEISIEETLNRRLRKRESKIASMDKIIEAQDDLSPSEFSDMLNVLGITQDDIERRLEQRATLKKTTLQEKCECFIRGALMRGGEMELNDLYELCESSGYTRGTSKRAIDATTQSRRESHKSYRFISKGSTVQTVPCNTGILADDELLNFYEEVGVSGADSEF